MSGDGPRHDRDTRGAWAVAERVSPHNLEAERALLGAILVDNGVFSAAADIVTDGTFFRMAHGQIWCALAATY